MVPDDDLDVGPEVAVGPRLEQRLQAVGLLRDEDGDGRGLAVGGEPDLHVDAECVAQVGEVVAEFSSGVTIPACRRAWSSGRSLADRLVEVLDVDAALEQERGHFGDEARVVLADDRNLSQIASHDTHLRTASSFI